MYCMAVGRDKPPGLYLALSKLYTYLCKVDQSMALHCFSLFADDCVAEHDALSSPLSVAAGDRPLAAVEQRISLKSPLFSE